MNKRQDLAAWVAGLPVTVQDAVSRRPDQTIRGNKPGQESLGQESLATTAPFAQQVSPFGLTDIADSALPALSFSTVRHESAGGQSHAKKPEALPAATVGVGRLEIMESGPLVPTLRLAAMGGSPSAAPPISAANVPTITVASIAPQAPVGSASLAQEVRGTGSAIRLGLPLGAGGMGMVTAAEQVRLGREVAVKSLKPERCDGAAARELVREAWLTGRLEHPNIVPVHDIEFDANELPLVVLKRITGVEWAKLLDDPDQVRRQFGAEDLLAWNLTILLQVINALRFAHSREVIHRDLKPSNVMIGSFGEVYLLDWGLAVSLRDDDLRVPRACDAVGMAGTPVYMAPEMLGTGDFPLSERSDIYIVGAVLFHIVTGAPPHTGSSMIEIVGKIALSQPAFPAHVPSELVRICQRAMAANPADRYPSLTELRHDLSIYTETRGADRIVDRAQQRLTELAALALQPRADRQQVYRLYHESRFGFHEAIAVAPRHARARAGLTATTVTAIDYELSVGQPVAALNLMGDLDVAPPELRARCEAAVKTERLRQQRFEALDAQMDSSIGARTRFVVAVVAGLLFTATPIFVWLAPTTVISYRSIFGYTAGILVVLASLLVWARVSMLGTLINRRISAITVFVPFSQAMLWVGLAAHRVPIPVGMVLTMGLWFVLAGAAAITIDAKLVISAACYLAAYIAATLYPPAVLPLAAASNFILTLNLMWMWKSGIGPRKPSVVA